MRISDWSSDVCSSDLARRVAAAEAVAEEIAERLDDRGIDRDRFCLEIPETQELANGDGALGVFRRLKEAGGHLALDDFGQGYSRLRLLHEHQPDYVKIDRSEEHTSELKSLMRIQYAVFCL